MSATATGTLERTPLSNLLIYCLDKGLSGTLVLQSPENVRHAIFFDKGVPAKVRTGDSVALLGRVLIEQEACSLPDVEDALVAARTLRCPVGEALIQAGRLAPEKLLPALRAQAHRKIVRLFSLPGESAYGFFEGKNLLESWGGRELAPVDTLALLWAGIKASPPIERIDAALVMLGDQPIRLQQSGDFKRFGLSERARGVLDLLRIKAMTLTELLNAGVASELEVKEVIYTFLLTRHLDLGGSLRPPVGSSPLDVVNNSSGESGRTAVARVKLKSMPRPRASGESSVASPSMDIGNVDEAPPSSATRAGAQSASTSNASLSSSESDARRREIIERAEVIDKETFFGMLHLPDDAPVDAVKAAYFQMAKRWHPDRLPGDLADVRDQAAKVFARLSEAFQTLTDPERRKQYLELMAQGAGSAEEQERVAQILDAQLDFQKAEVLLKKGDHAGAEKLVARAAEKDPEQSDYVALLAWLRATQAAATTEVCEASLLSFDQLLEAEPNHQRALWYRGLLRKRVGREGDAVSDFKRLLELDPKHIDATREVRVFEMRQAKKKAEVSEKQASSPPSAKPAEGDGKAAVPFGDLFGKLFKK